MAKHSYSSDSDQFDLKVFKESLGSFGTTTTPGGNQLTELQTKIRQGVKHVELHLASTGKGQFNVQDVPDKYGFEQRRTIMQLAKMNEQSLSVHGTFDVTSFSGMGRGGFDESQRAIAIKEIDETVKFASETAKSGAVVFHIQGDAIDNPDRGELNLSERYLNWFEEKANKDPKYKKELEILKRDYLDENNLKRQFMNNPDKERDVKDEFRKLKESNPQKYAKVLELAKKDGNKRDLWEYYYIQDDLNKQKISPDKVAAVVIGDKVQQIQRNMDIIDVKTVMDESKFTSKEKEILSLIGIEPQNFGINNLQRVQAIFTNGFPDEYEDKISKSDFEAIRDKIVISYDKVFKDNSYLYGQADKDYYKKVIEFQMDLKKLEKEDLEELKAMFGDELEEIRKIQAEERELAKQINNAQKNGNVEEVKKLKQRIQYGEIDSTLEKEINEIKFKLENGGENILESEKNNLMQKYRTLVDEANKQIGANPGILMRKQQVMQSVGGQLEFQKLENYNEMKAQINQKLKEFEEQKDTIKAFNDVNFEKNTSAMGHLGIKALKYQLNIKKKAKVADEKVKEYTSRLNDLEKKYNSANGVEKDKLHNEINKVKYEMRNWVGVKDYDDIDLIEKPLYLAPENMLPGMGTLTSIEEFKAVMRMSQEDFAEKILSDDLEYKKLREDYEKETGVKINTMGDAMKLAKRHLAGTFDNAHAAVWLKHFKREAGESDENRLERFNKWLNQQSVDMFKEGLIKHVHFNDTMGKDDDHNLLGSGILDLHDMRERLRKAGLKEPLIVEAGGRGANQIMHLTNAFNIFNPNLMSGEEMDRRGYSVGSVIGGDVSDWINARRNYTTRPQFSHYGMNYNTFRSQPQQGVPRGGWSNVGFF